VQLTWLAIAASLCMAFGAALLFFYAVQKDWLKDIEDAKYQVFWSDIEQIVDTDRSPDGHQPKEIR
jgi:hypothetical protein